MDGSDDGQRLRSTTVVAAADNDSGSSADGGGWQRTTAAFAFDSREIATAVAVVMLEGSSGGRRWRVSRSTLETATCTLLFLGKPSKICELYRNIPETFGMVQA